MITIFPELHCEGENINNINNKVQLIAKENEKPIGYINIKINDNTHLEIYDLKIDNNSDKYLSEALVKSAISFSINRNIYNITCKNKKLFPILEHCGFNYKSGILYINLFKTLKSCEQL